jgi:hypothetical protein
MATWLSRGLIIGAILIILARIMDLWAIPRFRKKREERKKRQAARRATLGQQWRDDMVKLREVWRFLEHLNSIASSPDPQAPDICDRLLRLLGSRAEDLQSPELHRIRKKLLRYSKKRDRLRGVILSPELRDLILGKYDRLSPQRLIKEISDFLQTQT